MRLAHFTKELAFGRPGAWLVFALTAAALIASSPFALKAIAALWVLKLILTLIHLPAEHRALRGR